MQVKRKELWINREPTGKILKTYKEKKNRQEKEKKTGNSQDHSCHHESSHLLSTCHVTGPGLDALSTFNLSSHSSMNWISLLPLLMGKMKPQNIAVSCRPTSRVRIRIQTPTFIFFPLNIDSNEKKLSA